MITPDISVEEELEASKHEGRPITKEGLRKSAVTWTGHEESLKMAAALMEEFQLPGGLLPLQDVVELGFERATGYFWIVQKKRIEHHFKVIGKLVAYAPDISGFLEKHRIKKVSGVKGKEFLLWVPVGDISLDPSSGKIHFKSLAGITKTFPVEAFAVGQ